MPIVTHVHGAVGVGDESDGYAEAWYLPAAEQHPGRLRDEGTWYDFFAGKAAAGYGATWGPGFATFQYPNDNRASTIWYHDHALGMTRLNVYAGPAGFYIVRGGPAGDGAVLDSRTGTGCRAARPGAQGDDKFPPNEDLLRDSHRHPGPRLQRRRFALLPGHTRVLRRRRRVRTSRTRDISPIWNPEFFGNTIMVNGNTWPFLNVEQRRYRFRFLNGCQSRFLILDFAQHPGRRGLADRQRGRLPGGSGEHHAVWATSC